MWVGELGECVFKRRIKDVFKREMEGKDEEKEIEKEEENESVPT